MILKEGRIVALILLLGSFVLFYLYSQMIEQGKKITIRTLAPLEAIPEAVGRCAEMGKPMFYCTGITGSLSNAAGAYTLASITILGSLSRELAKAGVRLKLFTSTIDAMPLIQETIKNAYELEGKPEDYSEDFIELIANQSSLVSRYLGSLQRENPAAACLIGSLAYESVVLAEAGNTIGAMQISGTINYYQIPFLVASTDYCLISEELYAAAAAVSGEAGSIGPIAAEDVIKLITLGIMTLGVVLAPMGITFLVNLLGM
ncbi:MAG: hypothetical protein NWE89_03395 [Candidatus Bathyarchaeota archaeon]|nr:hypothetical protein [Candidatus Bathyarchaeota archaeon]